MKEIYDLLIDVREMMDDPRFVWTPMAHSVADRLDGVMQKFCRDCEDDIIRGGECV